MDSNDSEEVMKKRAESWNKLLHETQGLFLEKIHEVRNGRRLQNINMKLLKNNTNLWKDTLSEPLKALLYSMMKQPAIVSVQKITALPNAEIQDIHRDHEGGSDKFIIYHARVILE